MSGTEEGSDVANAAARETTDIREGIQKTRAEMSATISALEQQLDPKEIRDKVVVELGHVEAKVKEAVHEQLIEASSLLRSELAAAKESVKADLMSAKESVQRDLSIAFDNAKQSVRDATLGKVETLATQAGDAMNDARDTLIETVRQNPLPATLAGIGLAWMLMNRSSASSRRRHEKSGGGGVRTFPIPYEMDAYADRENANDNWGVTAAARSAEHRAGQAADRLGTAVGHAAQGVSEAATQAAQGALETANRVVASTSERAGALGRGAYHAADQLAHQAHDVAGRVAETARSQATRLEEGIQATLRGNPIAVGAAALALGAAIGIALPRTRPEDELLGGTRDEVIHRARDMAQDAANAVAQASGKVAAQAKEALGQTRNP